VASVSVRLNQRAIQDQLTGQNGAIARDLLRRGQRVQNKARRLAPVDRGRLRGSITTEVRGSGRGLEVRVGSNLDYAVYVHEGTGIYAGRGYIYPRRGRYLRWRARGGGGGGREYVYARRVRGVRGRPFLKDALDAAR
jgi:hypothetical protein